jgi:hypothetical protein
MAYQAGKTYYHHKKQVFLVIGVCFFTLWVITSWPFTAKPPKPIQTSSAPVATPTLNQQADRDAEAVEVVKRCKIPGTKGDVLTLASGYLEIAKEAGSFIEFEGWAGFPVSSSLYEVDVAWKANGADKIARWDVDFKTKTIKPKNQEAFIFSGNKDLLKF